MGFDWGIRMKQAESIHRGSSREESFDMTRPNRNDWKGCMLAPRLFLLRRRQSGQDAVPVIPIAHLGQESLILVEHYRIVLFFGVLFQEFLFLLGKEEYPLEFQQIIIL